MGSMFDALLKAGLVQEDQREIHYGPNTDIPLPFFKPFLYNGGYSEFEQYHFDDINILNKPFAPLEDGELDDYPAAYGTFYKSLLEKYADKVRIVDDSGTRYGMHSFCVYFIYEPVTETFCGHIESAYEYEDICRKLGVTPAVNTTSYQEEFMRARIEHLCQLSDIIPLKISEIDTIMDLRGRPYLFKDIREDKTAMYHLKDFLSKQEFKPNPNRYYMICYESRIWYDNHWYLKRASQEQIDALEKTR